MLVGIHLGEYLGYLTLGLMMKVCREAISPAPGWSMSHTHWRPCDRCRPAVEAQTFLCAELLVGVGVLHTDAKHDGTFCWYRGGRAESVCSIVQPLVKSLG